MRAPHEVAEVDQTRATARDDIRVLLDAARAHRAEDDCPDVQCLGGAVGETIGDADHDVLVVWLAEALRMLADLPDLGPAAPDGVDPWAPYNYPPPPCARCDPRPCDCHEPGNLTGGDHAAS